jgi:hypothetical protein
MLLQNPLRQAENVKFGTAIDTMRKHCMKECCEQREGMGLLEYQAMPSLRDVAPNEWLCIFTI